MELIHNHSLQVVEPAIETTIISTDQPFIGANTNTATREEIQHKHIIPVYSRDNEPLISHAEFIETTETVVHHFYSRETVFPPAIRLSHPVKGRIPEARYKPAKELLEHEQTLYYERMAFIIEIPSICEIIGENPISLTVGGVKAYNLDNMHQRKGTDEHFKIFIGFQNKVCTNLCVWSDGYVGDLRVKSLSQLLDGIAELVSKFRAEQQLNALRRLTRYSLTEQQFAQLVGRCRLYPFISNEQKKQIPPLLLNDTQVSLVARDYFRDQAFCRMEDGSINLWKVYNLFTGANKSSYIDTFLDRSVNAFDWVDGLRSSLEHRQFSWYLQ